jgi:hypothetical protein
MVAVVGQPGPALAVEREQLPIQWAVRRVQLSAGGKGETRKRSGPAASGVAMRFHVKSQDEGTHSGLSGGLNGGHFYAKEASCKRELWVKKRREREEKVKTP